jgi:hypothetical protein
MRKFGIAGPLGLGICAILVLMIAAGGADDTGILKGRVLDAVSKKPIPKAKIVLEGTSLSAVTDDKGDYLIPSIPAGIYPVVFSARGFKSLQIPERLILAGKITGQDVELVETPYDAEEKVGVEADYFKKKAEEPLSRFTLGRTEISRMPGSIEDLSRVLNIFPSVSRVNELSSDLIVRGGSPFENGFYVDGIPVSNINYFQREGGSGGALGILNTDLIETVDFSSGGFSAVYGDRLSSIIDIKFRRGTTDRVSTRADLNVSGLGLSVEGPLPGGKGSWILSGKRSYYDILAKVFDIGVVPNMGNIHAKVDFRLTPRDRITVLDIFGTCRLAYGIDVAVEKDLNYATNARTNQNTLGLVWQHLWGDLGYSETSVSGSYVKNIDTLDDPFLGRSYVGRDEDELTLNVRNINVIRFDARNKIEFGFDARAVRATFNNYFSSYVDKWGLEFPGLQIDGRFRESLTGAFASHRINFSENLSLGIGLRGDYFTFNRSVHVSPRASITWKANPRLTLNFGGGLFRQTLYPLLLVRNPQSSTLKDPLAVHLIAGADVRLSDSAKMTLEFYIKEYRNLPQTPDDPTLFILDNNVAMTGYFQYDRLSDGGRAASRGVELFLQKKFGDRLSAVVSASLFRARFRDFNGVWRNRLYDNRILLTLIGRYRPNDRWDLNLRWNFAGGIPYTPFDVEKSMAANMGILERSNFFSERYPDYHSLFLRVDRRFVLRTSVLSIYLSLINAYNHNNIARYYWNRTDMTVSVANQAKLIPIFGVEMEF